jgi:hypothetical protein
MVLLICLFSIKQIKKIEQNSYSLNVVKVLETFDKNFNDIERQISNVLATLQAENLNNKLIELLTFLNELQNTKSQYNFKFWMKYLIVLLFN